MIHRLTLRQGRGVNRESPLKHKRPLTPCVTPHLFLLMYVLVCFEFVNCDLFCFVSLSLPPVLLYSSLSIPFLFQQNNSFISGSKMECSLVVVSGICYVPQTFPTPEILMIVLACQQVLSSPVSHCIKTCLISLYQDVFRQLANNTTTLR